MENTENTGSKPNTETQIITMPQMEQMFHLFQKMNKENQNSDSSIAGSELRLTEKLNYNNYTKWCRLIYRAFEGRGRLRHITTAPPSTTNPNYQAWKQKDSMVFSWIIANIEPDLVNQFLDYDTAWDLWVGIETLLGSGRDELQIFDLSSRAASIKQNNDTIEIYFSKLNTIWKEIDRRMPNPMKHSEDMTIFNSYVQT